jgi:hypothetical protein
MQPMPPLAAAADNELQELVSQLVGLKVGPAAACVALGRSLAEEGVMSLEDLRRLPSAEACKLLLRTAGMKELQVIKVVESYNPSPTPAAAVPAAPTPAAALGDARDAQTLWPKGWAGGCLRFSLGLAAQPIEFALQIVSALLRL